MRRVVATLFFLSALSSFAQQTGANVYQTHCALCHDRSAETRAPAPAALRQMPPANIVRSLESGQMKEQGAALTAAERQLVAEFLGAKAATAPAVAVSNLCPGEAPPVKLTAADWNGWSGTSNTRFQPASAAGGLNSSTVPKLKLQWAFAFPETFVAFGQPEVVGGRVYVASANRRVYSLDAKSGCEYWNFRAEAPVRTAVTIALPGDGKRKLAFFADLIGNAYALDASNGELIWKTHVEAHPRTKVVGAPTYYEGRLFVPVTTGEEGMQLNPKYECCTGRGALVSLDAVTGKQIWKTYTIAEEPTKRGTNWAGTATWGPSGASIWSAPTIDPVRKLVYAATGDNFSEPGTKTSDAVLAFDLQTGRIVWSSQVTENDVFNMGCLSDDVKGDPTSVKKPGCPDPNGPDLDFGSSPMLVARPDGKTILVIGQKSGVLYALDPDRKGAILWQAKLGKGGTLGGIQWGSSTDGRNAYAAVSDVQFKAFNFGTNGKPAARDLDSTVGGGIHAVDLMTGKKVWSAAPPVCGDRPNCSPAQSAAVTSIPGVVFSGGVDGVLRGYASGDGRLLWSFDTSQPFTTVNGVKAAGGAMDGPGPTVSGGMLYVVSGYGSWGGKPGNVLLAFSVNGE